ncbi:hypothetical protein EXW85_23925 [Klebsiella pneumoniae]|nr:hypothetical protein [Klebsiella pneumoniae]QJL20858.1 hypothetical protein HJX13_27665 [Klebsiella pneumoniae]
MFAGKKSAQIREILISESAWEEMTCLFAPSLGLYDMGLSGAEWSNDWYSTDYYSHSPVYDPQGPVKGNEKVLRGYVGGDRQYALTIFRQSSQPVPKFAGRDDYQKFGVSPLFVFRCVINK